MNSEEQTLIDGLFSRLRDTEAQSAPRDAQAEVQISQHLVRQPTAPYYMAQAILIQEAAIKRLDQQVKVLEAQVAELQQNRPSSGGFLAGLFGAGQRDAAPAPAQRPAGWGETRFSQQAAPGSTAFDDPRSAQQPIASAPGGGFLRGALQTAAGVAGGVVVADLLTGMFHHSQPQEIVEVIREDIPVQAPGQLDDNRLMDDPTSEHYVDTDAFDSSDFFDDDNLFS